MRTIVSMLLKAGADPNLGNDDDETPLMLAARARLAAHRAERW